MLSEFKDIPIRKEVQGGGNEGKPGKILRCPQEGCGKIFRSSPGYRYHLKSHDIDPRPHVCNVCHKKFKSANGLKYHLRKAHHIEPVASKQNLNGNATSPKGRDSISSEEDQFLSLNDTFSRGYMNGAFSTDRTPSIPSPLLKSPLTLTSPLVKNLPAIPSPLIKSPVGMSPYLSGSSTCPGLQSPYAGKDKYGQFYDKRNGKFDEFNSRSSLSEYTQQCQQANNEFRQQCQRLSTGDLSNPRFISASDFPVHRSNDYYRRPEPFAHAHSSSGSFSSDFHKNNNRTSMEEPIYSSMNDIKPGSSRDYNRIYEGSYKELLNSDDTSKYAEDLLNHSGHCGINGHLDSYNNNSNFTNNHHNNNNITIDCMSKASCSLQNTEQIVPDILSPGCQSSPTGYDRNNNNNNSTSTNVKNPRGASESSTETEFSDSVFPNENSNLSPTSTVPSLPTKSSSDVTTKGEPVFPASSVESMLQSPKSLLVRRTSRSKSIPSKLMINPSPAVETGILKTKDPNKKIDQVSRLRSFAEIATSPRFPASPLPFALTPGLLSSENIPEWNIKSPSTKVSFQDKSFLLTPTVKNSLALDGNGGESTSTHSLPASPFLDNIQTPSFWPSQMWPTPVWLCFLKGCTVKFEQDDKEFMTSEEVADFCTTPGGRKRDNMNFYTSGMKIVLIREETSVNSVREIVALTFEQIIPGTQRLVAKCPIDHPFFVKHRGWCAWQPTEAMARYGVTFRKLSQNDIVIQAPNGNNFVTTPGNTLSPMVKSSSAQVFTFNLTETKMFAHGKPKSESTGFSAPKAPDRISSTSSVSSVSSTVTGPPALLASLVKSEASDNTAASSSSVETITLTFSSKQSASASKNPTQKLVHDFKSMSEAIKQKTKSSSSSTSGSSVSSIDTQITDLSATKISFSHPTQFLQSGNSDTTTTNRTNFDNQQQQQARKKRRKPIAGSEKDRRPMNGFMLFAKSMRVELTKEFPGKDNRAISKLLGERWRELSEEKREEFSRMAKEMADERMKVNPDCWKRKTKKEKEGATNSNSNTKSDNVTTDGPDAKKQKVQYDKTDEFNLPTQFIDSPGFLSGSHESVGKPQSFLSSVSGNPSPIDIELHHELSNDDSLMISDSETSTLVKTEPFHEPSNQTGSNSSSQDSPGLSLNTKQASIKTDGLDSSAATQVILNQELSPPNSNSNNV